MRIVFAAIVIALIGVSSCTNYFQKLNKLTKEELIDFALKAQSIDRKNKGIEEIFGGLEDYVYTLNKEQIILIIMDFARENSSLLTVFDESSFAHLSLEELRNLALACEAFEKNANNNPTIGGLHDFIGRLLREEVEIILERCTQNNPGFDVKSVETDKSLKSNEIKKLDLVVEKLSKFDIKKLRKIVVIADEIDRKRAARFGGLAEVVDTLNKGQLIEEFIKLAIQNSELLDLERIESLENEYKDIIDFSDNFSDVVTPALGENPAFNPQFFLASLETINRNDLKKIAVALDEEIRLISPRVGGVADRVNSMSTEELVAFITESVFVLNRNLNIEELIEKHQERIRYSQEIAAVIPNTRKNLRTSSNQISELARNLTHDQLIELTIIADELDRQATHKRGGVAERISNITNNEMFEIIANAEKNYPERLNIKNLESLSKEFESRIKFAKEYLENSNKKSSKALFQAKDDFMILNYLKIEELEAVAIIVDEFEREIKPRVGGIAERVHDLTPADLKNFIEEKFVLYPELRNLEKLEELKKKFQHRIDFANEIIKVVKVPKLSSQAIDLTGFFSKLSLNDLRELAVALDEYDRKINPRRGGLAEYVNRLSKVELLEIIQKYILRYDELKSIDTLKSIVNEYLENIRYSKEYNQRNLNNILANYNKNQLVKIVLGLEKYSRAKNNIDVIGGIHDYVATLDEAQLIAKIAEFSDELPEVFDAEFIENLIKESKEPTIFEVIRAQPRETLIIIATALEAFERETTGKQLFGGIHDNAPRLTNEELFIFIEDIIRRFPLLQVAGNLENVLNKFTQ